MPSTSRKPASPGKTLGLALRESLFVFGWGLLGGALLLPFFSLWYLGIPPAFLIAAYVLSAMEERAGGDPLTAMELKQLRKTGGRNIPRWSIFIRITTGSILLLPAAIGYAPLLFGGRSFPEMVSGLTLRETDRRLNPRPAREIERTVKSASARMRTLTLAPLVASAAMFFMGHSTPEVILVQENSQDFELPESERELLAQYLELTTLHPEELEYHVRLASLYYRNDMTEDLNTELDLIRSIDPEHAILLLADTTEFSFAQLEPAEEDSVISGVLETIEVPAVVTEEDSTESDSSAVADSIVTDSLPAPVSDTLQTVQVDSSAVEAFPSDTIPDQPGEQITEEEPEETDTAEQEPEDTPVEPAEQQPQPEEEISEPDTLVQTQG